MHLPLEELQELEHNLRRVVELYQKSITYWTHDPESSLTKARQLAEHVGKHLYSVGKLERQNRPLDRIELNEILSRLEASTIVPKHITPHFRVIQAYGNFGTHDQGAASRSITPDYIDPCISALRQVTSWYIGDYHQRSELARSLVGVSGAGVSAVGQSDVTLSGFEEWLDDFWWAHRQSPPKLLDLRAADATQKRHELTEASLSLARAAIRRDLATFQNALLDAFEDHFVEVSESEALEAIRTECCVSQREAARLVAALKPGQLTCRSTGPGWLIRGLTNPSVTSQANAMVGVTDGIGSVVPLGGVGGMPSALRPLEGSQAAAGQLANAADCSDQAVAAFASGAATGLTLLLSSNAEARANTIGELVLANLGRGTNQPSTEQLQAAVLSCRIPSGEIIIFCFDLTLLGSASDACVLTSEAVYVHNPWYSPHAGPHRIDWSDLAIAELRIKESEVIVERNAHATFIWSWNEEKRIKKVLTGIQRYLRSPQARA